MEHKEEPVTGLVGITKGKDGQLFVEINLPSETVADDSGDTTTFLTMTKEQLQSIYAEFGYYLFDFSLGEKR